MECEKCVSKKGGTLCDNKTFWLIEQREEYNKTTYPQYITADHKGFRWTSTANTALKFLEKFDAKSAADAIIEISKGEKLADTKPGIRYGDLPPAIIEHGFIGKI